MTEARDMRRRIATSLAAAARRMCALRSKTRYSRALDAELERARAENARLQQENRALLNSILGIAGIPPIPVDAATPISAELPRSVPSPQPGPQAPAQGPVSPFSATEVPGITAASRDLARIAAPLRRRSWHQINRALEFEAARKKPQKEPADG